MRKSKNDAPDFPESEPYPLLKLRQMISAMNMVEKNAFKRYIRNYREHNSDSVYIRLFDCINDCLMEDERSVKRESKSALPHEKSEIFYLKFKSRNARRSICKPAELGSIANYLFEKLLESQRSRNPEKSIRRELYMRMLDVQFLFVKDMREECLSMVRYATKLATELEALPQLMELKYYERRLLTQSRQSNLEQQLRQVHAQEEKSIQQLQLTIFFNDLLTEIVLLQWKQGNVDDDEVLRSKINFFVEYANENKAFDDTFDLTFYYHAILAALVRLDTHQPSRFLEFLQHNGYETITRHYNAIVDLYKRYPERKRENFVRYLGDLSNYLSHAYNLSSKLVDLADFQEDLGKIKLTDPNFLNFTVYFTLIDRIKNKQFLEAKTFLQDKKIWERTVSLGSQAMPSRLQVIRHLAASVYFVREEFEEADRWFRANLETANPGIVNAEVMIASELYHLIARYELRKTSGITYKKELLTQLSRRLGPALKPDSFEQLLLDVMEKIMKTGHDAPAKLKSVCEKYLLQLKPKLDQKSEAGHFHLFIGWLESKSTGKPLRITVDPYL